MRVCVCVCVCVCVECLCERLEYAEIIANPCSKKGIIGHSGNLTAEILGQPGRVPSEQPSEAQSVQMYQLLPAREQ